MTDAEGDTIDVDAAEFTERLALLQTQIDDGRLAEAEVKWNYISARMVDYQSQTVPCLIARYSDSIVKKLMHASQGIPTASGDLALN